MFEYCIKTIYSKIEKVGFRSILLETSRERERERDRNNYLEEKFVGHFHKASVILPSIPCTLRESVVAVCYL